MVLGLVYLMFPPRSIMSREQSTWELELHAPLHRWVHIESYDTAAQCEAGAMEQARRVRDQEGEFAQKSAAQLKMFADAVYWHMCVATDDPRLR
jgi:hypothetical protein